MDSKATKSMGTRELASCRNAVKGMCNIDDTPECLRKEDSILCPVETSMAPQGLIYLSTFGGGGGVGLSSKRG